jgi:hypothetical protein
VNLHAFCCAQSTGTLLHSGIGLPQPCVYIGTCATVL